MAKDKTPWHGCPIRYGMGIWGDKWSLLIVRDLMFKGKRHYGEFSDPEETLATNILADRLKKLEEGGIITKARDPEKGSRFIYGLTQKGKDMLPIMLEIVNWSERYDGKTGVPEEFISELRKSPKRFETKLRKQLDRLYPG